MKKISKNYRLSETTIELLEMLSEKLDISNTKTIESAILHLALVEFSPEEVSKVYIKNHLS